METTSSSGVKAPLSETLAEHVDFFFIGAELAPLKAE